MASQLLDKVFRQMSIPRGKSEKEGDKLRVYLNPHSSGSGTRKKWGRRIRCTGTVCRCVGRIDRLTHRNVFPLLQRSSQIDRQGRGKGQSSLLLAGRWSFFLMLLFFYFGVAVPSVQRAIPEWMRVGLLTLWLPAGLEEHRGMEIR